MTSKDNQASRDNIAQSLEMILREVGEDPQREGLLKTPQRFAKAIRFLTSGYAMDAKKTIESALFNVDCEEMVIVKDIEFYSFV
ncbi:MAG: GTP cyclohydrolase I [Candidatus Oxydemutatoraceae bacterium WSBS_2016_MAG_OTU14]